MTFDPRRRRYLVGMGALFVAPLAATPVLAEERAPTPRMTEGPFYPRQFPKDVDGDLTRVAGRSGTAQGTVLDVHGRVLDRRGAPVANAKLEVWQCDNDGHYLHVGELQPAGDANFQGFGAVTTDAEGRYRFRTIKPVAYPGRTPHIHFQVKEGERSRLISQMFVEGEPLNERDGLYRRLGGEQKLVTLKLEDAPKESGARLRGALDIVLRA